MIDTYVSIDIETTGIDPENCQILEIGAVIDNCKDAIEDCPTFHGYVDNGTLVGEPYALSMHPIILRRIAVKERGFDYLRPEYVVDHFLQFLRENNLKPERSKISVAGKNYAGFDARFLSKIDGWDGYINTDHRVIDPGMMYWDHKIDGMVLPDMKTCMKRAGIDGDVAHTAVEDARVVCMLIRRKLGIML